MAIVSRHRKATTSKPKRLHLLKGVYQFLVQVVAMPPHLNQARIHEVGQTLA